MTRRQLDRRIEHWRRRILPEWRLTVMPAGPDWKDEESFLATCQADDDYHHAKLYFTSACLARSDEDVDVTIVHELLHQSLRELRRVLDMLEGQGSAPVHEVATEYFRVEEEKAVERLSRVIIHADRGSWSDHGTIAGTIRFEE